MLKKLLRASFSLFLIFAGCSVVHAQPMWTIDLLGNTEKKPEKFENRKLGSEKFADKKFTVVRRFFQNNYTHFNYFYNANNKINLVLERAKESQQDDYTRLLSFYPYSLENTATQKNELDSVIYKATAGILLHDLRNAWIDNMYLLMGKAYFLRKDFDSAAATFQFIQYNLFPRKKDEDDNRIVGTNADAASKSISIANKEKLNILQKVTAQPPSRNDALLWLARTLIEQREMGDAAGLIHTLQQDPNLPKRLQDDLQEIAAYWFYQEEQYDSTAAYLERSLSVAENKRDKARSEFLLAQLYEKTGDFAKASQYYNLASQHTTVQLMDIYAQMNNAKMRRGDDLKELERGINNLVKLTRKDNFENYRDILFYAAGELALVKPDTNQAIGFYTRSFQLNQSNIPYKNKAFLRLGDIAYIRHEYQQAYNFYDSLQSGDTTLGDLLEKIQTRRAALGRIVEKLQVVQRQDSLQRIAAMPEPARSAFVKKLAKKLRKERGYKEEDIPDSGPMLSFSSKNDEPVDLFATPKSGEWYFYNTALKAKGFTEFKRKWGTRTNADNWRRKNAQGGNTSASQQPDMAAGMPGMSPDDVDGGSMNPDAPADSQNGKLPANGATDRKNSGSIPRGGRNAASGMADNVQKNDQAEDLSFEGLMSNLPLTPELLDNSNHLLATNLFALGSLYQSELEDYAMAIETYDSSLKRYPDSLYGGDLYLGLYFCHTKMGHTAEAARYKKLLDDRFNGSAAYKKLHEPAATASGQKSAAGTQQYEQIYQLFIEGKFEEAVQAKKMADSVYGNQFWSPQLLYIESVFYVRQRNDSVAITTLEKIGSLYPDSKLKSKADRLIQVLKRRGEIEDYLTKLQVTRYKEDTIVIAAARVPMKRDDSRLLVPQKKTDSTAAPVLKPADQLQPVKRDSALAATNTVSGPYVFNHANAHHVLMVLDKVDGTYVNESKNALSRYVNDYFRDKQLTITRDALDNNLSLIDFSSLENANEALLFIQKIRKAAPDELSWLPANKYYFILIDNDNLIRLKNTKDIQGYLNLLRKQFAGQF